MSKDTNRRNEGIFKLAIGLGTLLVLWLLFAPAFAQAADVSLSWTAPTTCNDGSALTFCPTTGFEISEGASLTGIFAVKETVAATVVTRTVPNVVPGTKCYFVKTVSNALKSAESNRSCVDVPSLPPKAPQGMTVTVTVTVSTP